MNLISALNNKKKLLGWITVFLTVLVLIVNLTEQVPPRNSSLDFIVIFIVYVWFSTVILQGIVLSFLKRFVLGIGVIVLFPISIFVSPHFFELTGFRLELLLVVQMTLQFLIPISSSVYLIRKSSE